MSRTNDLRKLIKTKLDTLKTSQNVTQVYYKTASDNAMYPHIVYTLTQLNMLTNDNNRKDYKLEVDVWDAGTSEAKALDIADAVEKLFNVANLPQTNILPTFFLDSRISVLDEDKRIKHELIKFIIQLYEK